MSAPRPDNNPKSVFGMAKPGIHAIPPVALLHCGRGMEDGERKYGLTNWRENSVSGGVYYDAAFRHLAAWWDGEQVASDSGVHHLGHVMACCAILLDAEAGCNLIDDRPSVPGKFSEMVKAMTRATEPEQPGIGGLMDSEEPLTAEQGAALDEMIQTGMCEDEGCDHHGTAHICLEVSDEFRAQIEAEMQDDAAWAAIQAESKPKKMTLADLFAGPGSDEAAKRDPVQAGGPHDPGMDKTHEIKAIVRNFVQAAPAGQSEARGSYVTDWLDRNGIKAVSQMGSIRDQCALYDHIDRYYTDAGFPTGSEMAARARAAPK